MTTALTTTASTRTGWAGVALYRLEAALRRASSSWSFLFLLACSSICRKASCVITITVVSTDGHHRAAAATVEQQGSTAEGALREQGGAADTCFASRSCCALYSAFLAAVLRFSRHPSLQTLQRKMQGAMQSRMRM